MQIRTFTKPRFYVRKDPDAGWTLALWKWRVFFNMPPNSDLCNPLTTPAAE